jgi:hypothetical protein
MLPEPSVLPQAAFWISSAYHGDCIFRVRKETGGDPVTPSVWLGSENSGELFQVGLVACHAEYRCA